MNIKIERNLKKLLTPLLLGASLLSAYGAWYYDLENGLHDEKGNKLNPFDRESRSQINSIEISNNVTSIGGWAFKGCDSLENITIPNSVTSIGESAFEGCSSLTSITIPKGVTSIEFDAFKDSALTSIRKG